MTDHADPAGRSPGGPPVRVRFAPSPSGDLHVGNIRTALFDWAFARHTGGVFVLRIEDTDQSRVLPAYIESALDTLRWLGLDWDEGPEVGGPYGPYLQSERLGIYNDWVVKFLESGHAYYCYCTTEEVAARRAAARSGGSGPSGYDGRCRNLTPDQVAAYQEEGRRPVVRLRMPDGATTFTDLVRGEITIENEHVPDFVLQRADGSPLYTLAVAVDDVLMKMTHIVRGDDLLSSTPRQLAVYRRDGGARVRVPGVRAPAVRARARGREARQALRRRVDQLLPRRGVPARGDLQLPGAARLVAGGQPGVVHAGRDGRRVRPGPGQQERGPVRRAEAGVDQRRQDPGA